MSRYDDVVIANGVCQEVLGLTLVCQLDDLLRTTEVGLCLIAYERSLSNKVTFQIARNFKDGDGPFLHESSDGDTDT